MLKKTVSGLSAGLLITIGGSVFLACDNRYVGAVMFSVALLCICLKGYARGSFPKSTAGKSFPCCCWACWATPSAPCWAGI